MPSPQLYVKGDWNAICDCCGRQYKASKLLKRWDGLMVCVGDWEPRQPQDFVKGVADKMVPPWTRPEPADIFIQTAADAQEQMYLNGTAVNVNTVG